MGVGDSFTCRWTYRSALSKMSTPGPRSWVKTIECEGDAVSVREEIDFGGGNEATVEIEAKFNGKSYPVSGSPVADTIAYTRLDSHTISGTACKQGIIAIRETLVAAEEGDSMRMTYSVFRGKKKVARGIAVFERTGIR